jgi:nucleotide-binding universal stress UspA family protein
MATQKIIVPTDFSPNSEAALEYAATLAQETGARLIFVHVQELPVVYPEGSIYYGLPVPDQDEVQSMLENVKPAVQGVSFEHRLLKGDPSVQIAALAKDEKADLIVMSSLGRSGLGRLILGSVAEAVMRRAACPILIVKPSVKAEPLHTDHTVASSNIS